jgi:hypothetical protein
MTFEQIHVQLHVQFTAMHEAAIIVRVCDVCVCVCVCACVCVCTCRWFSSDLPVHNLSLVRCTAFAVALSPRACAWRAYAMLLVGALV